MSVNGVPDQVVQCITTCRRQLDERHLVAVAAAQAGPPEPVLEELKAVFFGSVPTLKRTSPCREALSLYLFGTAAPAVTGLHMLCCCLLVEDAITERRSTTMDIHSALPRGIADACALGPEAIDVFQEWLLSACSRLPNSTTRTDPLSVTTFFHLGIFLLGACRTTKDATVFIRLSAAERTDLDRETIELHGDDLTQSIFDLDPYMSKETEWRILCNDTLAALRDVIGRVYEQIGWPGNGDGKES